MGYVKYYDYGNQIPINQLEEFKNRLHTLLTQGGFMKIECTKLLGVNFQTISLPKWDAQGNLFVDYNYLKDELIEKAGFSSKDNHVFSSKLGQYTEVFIAAYVLQGLYTDGYYAILDNHSNPILFFEERCIEWINGLFDESFVMNKFDAQQMLDFLDEHEIQYNPTYLKKDMTNKEYIDNLKQYYPISVEGICLIWGTNRLYEEMLIHSFGQSIEEDIEHIQNMKDVLQRLKEQRISLDIILNLIDQYQNDIIEYVENCHLNAFIREMKYIGSSMILSIIIAEVYDVEFSKIHMHINRLCIKRSKFNKYVYKTTTQDFLNLSNDQFIYMWRQEQPIQFSKELINCFDELKQEYNITIQEDIHINDPTQWIVDIIKTLNNHFKNIYIFTDFLEETLSNITDQRYLTLWRILEKMCYLGNKKNEVKSKIKNYLALIYNKELRKEIFDF